MSKINKIKIAEYLERELELSKLIKVNSIESISSREVIAKDSLLKKILDKYQSNDLIRYAFLSFVMLMS